MIKLKSILSEMRIVSAPKNHLSKLEEIRVKIKNKSTPKEEKQRLVLEAAKLVLPIWEVYYKDDRPRLAIQATEEYLNNPTEKNEKKMKEATFAADNAADVAYAANNIAAAYAAYSAAFAAADAAFAAASAYSAGYYTGYAINSAIKATKEFFKIK